LGPGIGVGGVVLGVGVGVEGVEGVEGVRRFPRKN
jgi:hypothetical protein